jgi:hypothetical protein
LSIFDLLCKMEECKAFAKSVPTLYTILLVIFLGDCKREEWDLM